MSPEHTHWEFGIVMATVCVPFFLLIGSLNTTKGYAFWKGKSKAVYGLVLGKRKPKAGVASSDNESEGLHSIHRFLAFTNRRNSKRQFIGAVSLNNASHGNPLGETPDPRVSDEDKTAANVSADGDGVTTGQDNNRVTRATMENQAHRNIVDMRTTHRLSFMDKFFRRRRDEVAHRHSV